MPIVKNDSQTVKYFCACNSCKRVYAYKAYDGSSFGTRNQLQLHHSVIRPDRLLMLAGRVRVTYMMGRVGSGPENIDPWPTLSRKGI